MKNLVCLFILLFNFQVLSNQLSFNDCNNESLIFLESILQTQNGKEVLSKQFHITLLKMATLANSDNLKTIEEYSQEWAKELGPNDLLTLSKLSREYKQSQYLTDLNIVEDKFLKASYYNKELRFNNKEASVFALSHKILENNSPFNDLDISILWFASQMNEAAERSSGKFSYLYNKTSVSSLLTNYSGLNKNKRPLTKSEIRQLQSDHENDYMKSLTKIEKSFKIHLTSLGCLDEKGIIAGSCSFNANYFTSLLNESIYNLESLINIDELNALTISNDLVAKYKGKAIFQFLSVKESNVEMANPIEPTDWKLVYDESKKIEPTLKLQETINDIPDLKERVKSFAFHAQAQNYVIVDSRNDMIEYYDKDGTLLEKIPYQSENDDRFLTGGAGVYRLNKIGKNGELFIQGQNSNTTRPIASNINFRINKNTPVVILPKEDSSTLIVKDGELLFKKNITPSNYYAYNYTNTSGREFRPIKITFLDKELEKSNLLVGYVKALQEEKEKLMRIYNLTNDEYNLLAKFSFGVMKPESQMGEFWKYKVKEAFPFAVTLKKWWDGNDSANSRGPTQIKKIPDDILREYKITKDDLKHPRPAAIATLGFCAELLADLKRLKKFHPDIDEDNIVDYLYYLYRGKRNEILKAKATPNLNKNIREIKKMSNKLQIYQEL